MPHPFGQQPTVAGHRLVFVVVHAFRDGAGATWHPDSIEAATQYQETKQQYPYDDVFLVRAEVTDEAHAGDEIDAWLDNIVALMRRDERPAFPFPCYEPPVVFA
jgi:hypothetical protein